MKKNSLNTGGKVVKFGVIADNIAVRVKPSEADSDIYVGLEHLDPETLHLKKWGHPSDVDGDKLRFWKGDVIFGRRRAYQRKLAIAECDGICSAHAMVLRAKPKIILPEFLPFFLQSDMFMERAIGISVGSLSPTINWRTLREEEFPLPPIDEQKRIAEILWAADEAVEIYKTVSASLQDLKIQLFRDLLKRSSNRRVKCEALFKSPPRNGYSPQASFTEKGFATLSIGAIREGRVHPDGNLKYAEISSADMNQFRLRPGDLLVVRGNGNRELCGKAGIVSTIPEDCFYPDLLIRIKFDEKMILPEFALNQWNEPATHRKLLAYAKSTNGIWKVNGKDLRDHKLIVPPLATQQTIVDRLSSIETRGGEISSHIKLLEDLKWTMINKMVMIGNTAYV